MEFSMSVLNGFDATIQIRNMKGHKKNPIIAAMAST